MLYKVRLEYAEIHSGDVFIEADSKEEALRELEENKDDYVDCARENTTESYEGLEYVKVRTRSIKEEDDESIMADNVQED